MISLSGYLDRTFFFIFLQLMGNKNKNIFLLTILLLVVVPTVFAQDAPPPPAQQGPVELPIDGGVIALVLAGLFYGIKKSLKKK